MDNLEASGFIRSFEGRIRTWEYKECLKHSFLTRTNLKVSLSTPVTTTSYHNRLHSVGKNKSWRQESSSPVAVCSLALTRLFFSMRYLVSTQLENFGQKTTVALARSGEVESQSGERPPSSLDLGGEDCFICLSRSELSKRNGIAGECKTRRHKSHLASAYFQNISAILRHWGMLASWSSKHRPGGLWRVWELSGLREVGGWGRSS